MIDFIGLAGSILLAICALPLAIESIANKRIDINLGFLLCWTLGEIFTFIYIFGDWILMLNYGINIFLLIPVWRYRK